MIAKVAKTLSALAVISLVAGCKDDASPAPVATSEAAPADAPPKVARPLGGLNPALRQIMKRPGQPTEASDAGAAADGGSAADAGTPAARVLSFDKDKVDAAPEGFVLGVTGGKPGKWLVQADSSAPSGPNVLAQLEAEKADARFVTALVGDASARDVRVGVRCKLVSGKGDQAAGIVARFKDDKSYYVARADALAKDVGLFVVKEGKLTRVGGGQVPAFGDGWHELRVEAKGEHLEVSWDGARVFGADDKTYPDAGRIGLWTKGDTVARFDDLSISAL